jgi:hypothetical protein
MEGDFRSSKLIWRYRIRCPGKPNRGTGEWDAAFLDRMRGPWAMSKGIVDDVGIPGEHDGLGHRCKLRHWARDRLNSSSF